MYITIKNVDIYILTICKKIICETKNQKLQINVLDMHLLHLTVRSRQNFFSEILRNTLKLASRCKQRFNVWESMSERKVFYITYKRQYTPSDN